MEFSRLVGAFTERPTNQLLVIIYTKCEYFRRQQVAPTSTQYRASLERRVAQLGITRDQTIITFCRSGHRSTHTWFVFKYVLGFENVLVYDGSMRDWARVELANSAAPSNYFPMSINPQAPNNIIINFHTHGGRVNNSGSLSYELYGVGTILARALLTEAGTIPANHNARALGVSRQGFVFGYWSLSAGSGNPINLATHVFNQDTTVHAVWYPITITHAQAYAKIN